jgi:cell division protein FtsI (penicillin-binding protein 3)
MNLGLTGLVEINEPARFYPTSGAAAQILGFTGLDNNGLSGLERQFDKDLRGKGLKAMASKDARGNFIVKEAVGAAPERTGNSIYLTIDSVIQEIAEEELANGVRQAMAKRGFVIVSDPHTGRILAVANYPTFDPNNNRHVKLDQARNGAFLDTFEPGSVIKPFIIAQALENKTTTPETLHNCESGSLRIGNRTIHDTHGAATLTTAETLIRSSNICTYKIANQMGRQSTYDALISFGFSGKNNSLGFPGETTGFISGYRNWAQIRFANVAFGHGFVVTGLELVQAMGALANGGHLMKPTLIEKIVSSDGLLVSSSSTKVIRDVVTPGTARTMRGILQRVVTDPHGTGKRSASVGYSTAGKTGTAQKVESGVRGYAKGKYIASFVGFAPVEDPHLAMYVMIDEPGGKLYYGGEVAGPVFARIVERTLRYLNVAPDLPVHQEKVASPSMATTERREHTDGHGSESKKL